MNRDESGDQIIRVLERVTDGWPVGRLPREPVAGPYLNSIWPLNRGNGRLVLLDGVQCLIWFDEQMQALVVEFRIFNPWFPGHHWPGACRFWSRRDLLVQEDAVVQQARDCVQAVASLRRLKDTALTECNGTSTIYCKPGEQPDFRRWVESYLLAHAVTTPILTPRRAQELYGEIRQVAASYFIRKEHSELPEEAGREFITAAWLSMDILAGQTGVTNRAFRGRSRVKWRLDRSRPVWNQRPIAALHPGPPARRAW